MASRISFLLFYNSFSDSDSTSTLVLGMNEYPTSIELVITTPEKFTCSSRSIANVQKTKSRSIAIYYLFSYFHTLKTMCVRF